MVGSPSDLGQCKWRFAVVSGFSGAQNRIYSCDMAERQRPTLCKAASRSRERASMSRPDRRNTDGTPSTGVVTKSRAKTKKPSMYKVLMLNDDYTPMEFVVHVLERFFAKSHEDAVRIMLHVHHRGVGVCGVFTYEIAEAKVNQVMDLARQHQHPLQCTIEKDGTE